MLKETLSGDKLLNHLHGIIAKVCDSPQAYIPFSRRMMIARAIAAEWPKEGEERETGTLNALTQIREALCAFEFMDHADAGWLLMRSSLKQARGAGSIRLEDGWLKGMRLLFKERDAALAIIDKMIEGTAKPSEMLLNFPMNATEFELFKSWKTTQGGNIDQTDYEAWKAGYRTALAGLPKREIVSPAPSGMTAMMQKLVNNGLIEHPAFDKSNSIEDGQP